MPKLFTMHAYESDPSQDVGEKIGVDVGSHIQTDQELKTRVSEDNGEVFKNVPGQTDFRALGW